MTDKFVKVELVAVRLAKATNGKRIMIFNEIVNGARATADIGLLRSNVKRAFVGQIYEIECNEERTGWRSSTLKWVRTWPDEVDLSEWQLTAAAVEAAERAEDYADKHNDKTKGFERELRRIRYVYQGLAHSQKLPFEVWLIHQLRK